MRRTSLLATACLLAALDTVSAQQDPAPTQPIPRFVQSVGMFATFAGDDYYEAHLNGGFVLALPQQRLEIRGDNALLMLDAQAFRAAVDAGQDGKGLPTRGIPSPPPRRTLSEAAIRERMQSLLSAIGRPTEADDPAAVDRSLELLRYLYCEGGIVVIRDGVEVLRCERLWISPADDRIVVEGAELRYFSIDQGPGHMLVVRGPRLERQNGRWTGRSVTVTTCTASQPHMALAIDDVEILEREGEFEVVARGQTLQIGGIDLLPLPNARVFTGSQDEFPIKRVRGGYSQQLGYQGEVVLGLPWNKTGGALHEWLLGRPASEFRGDWQVGVGWIQERGVPLEGQLKYRAGDLYEGLLEGFWLDDTGRNIREIRTELDGSPIDDTTRTLLRTQNRVHLGPTTNLDLVAFQASDPAVWSEFYSGYYRSTEVPETSTYLHHGSGNRLLTVGSRFNLDDFSYRDDRALATRFVEELPVVTYQWLAQPLGTTPWDTPIVVDLATEIGQRRSAYDDLAAVRESDRSLRLDQLIELSAPFHAFGLNLRPYASGRGTFYDETVDGSSEGRIATEVGLQLGTLLKRSWSWLDGDEQRGVRHLMSPKLTYKNRFHVDDSSDRFYTFDDLDRLREQQLVRLELRNQLQRTEVVDGKKQPRDFVFLDVAQDLFPDKAQDDTDDDGLGLLYYDLLLRPPGSWSAFENFSLAVYGDHDWRNGLRTFDSELQFGPVLGVNWSVEYRTDELVKGTVLVGAGTRLRERWGLFGLAQRDIELDEWLTYSFGLRRDDHDWSILLNVIYNPFTDDTTFRIDFQPQIGNFASSSRDRMGSGRLLDPANAPH